MQLIIGSKIKERDSDLLNENLDRFYYMNEVGRKVNFATLTEAILEYLLRKGTILTKLWLFNDYLHIYKEGERRYSVSFRKIAHCFNGNIKESLINWADKMLEISKRIHGEKNMKNYLSFYHVKYCKKLTDEERKYLERERNMIKSFYRNIFL